MPVWLPQEPDTAQALPETMSVHAPISDMPPRSCNRRFVPKADVHLTFAKA